MAATVKWYGKGNLHVVKQDVNLLTATLKATLHTSSYAPNRDTHEFRSDLTNEVAAANGYSTGGVRITTPALSYDATSHQVRFDFDDLAWTFTGAVTWRYLVVQNVRGGASSADELIGLVDYGADQTASVPYTVQLATTGLLYNDCT